MRSKEEVQRMKTRLAQAKASRHATERAIEGGAESKRSAQARSAKRRAARAASVAAEAAASRRDPQGVPSRSPSSLPPGAAEPIEPGSPTTVDEVLRYKAQKRARAVRRAIARSKAILPGAEEREELAEHARQSEDAVTMEPTPEDFDAVVRLKELLRAAKAGEPFEVIGDLELADAARRERLRPPTKPCCPECAQNRPCAGEAFGCVGSAFGGVVSRAAGVVSNEEINDHNRAVTTLNSEINYELRRAGEASGTVEGAKKLGYLATFINERWHPYLAEWKSFATDTPPSAALGAIALAWWMSGRTETFSRLKAGYNDLRAEFKKLGFTTEAPEVGPAGPGGLEKKVADKLSETLETVVTYGMIGGAAYLLFTFLSSRAGKAGGASLGASPARGAYGRLTR